MKNKEIIEDTKTSPKFARLVCTHSGISVLLAFAAACVSGLVGLGFSDLGSGMIWYYGGVILLIIAPLFNGIIYCHKMMLKQKLAAYRLIAITYGMIVLCGITFVLPKIQNYVDFSFVVSKEAIYILVAYIGNSLAIMWIEFKQTTWKEKEDE